MNYGTDFDSGALPDGQIEPDSDVGKALGFTSDKFEGWLWKTGDRVLISMIVSLQEGKGHLRSLFDAIEARGLKVAVPTPFARMKKICKLRGYKMHVEHDPEMGPCEVWAHP